jgi:hypothetical protein
MSGAASSTSPDWRAELLGVNLRIATLEGELYMVKAHKQFILRCLRKNATADGAAVLLASSGLKRSDSDSSQEGVRASHGVASAMLQPSIPSAPGPLPLVKLESAEPDVAEDGASQPVELDGPRVKRRYVRTPDGECPKCFREGQKLRGAATQHLPACPKALLAVEEKTCPACKKKAEGKLQGSAKHFLDCEHRPGHKKVSSDI